MNNYGSDLKKPDQIKSLVIVFSYHHRNTEKIATVFAEFLGATVKTPQQVRPEEVGEYDLIGFGSGIYDGTFGIPVLDLANRLPESSGKTNTFLFSTFGLPASFADRKFIEKNHSQMREKLTAKGYTVLDEFGCAGWNTNSFLKYFGGVNKGRPDARDLVDAEMFARNLAEKQIPGKPI